MPKETAMTEFVEQLDAMCPLFRPYVQAHKTEKEEKLRKQWVFNCAHLKKLYNIQSEFCDVDIKC